MHDVSDIHNNLHNFEKTNVSSELITETSKIETNNFLTVDEENFSILKQYKKLV